MAHDRYSGIEAFLQFNHWKDADVKLIAGDASFRKYYRATKGNKSVIVMDAPPQFEKVDTFITIDEYLKSINLHAPTILAHDLDNGFLLLEDFGDDRFTRLLTNDLSAEEKLYTLAVDALIHLHKQTPPPIAPYNDAEFLREMRLFSEWYAPAFFDIKESFVEQYEMAINTILEKCHFSKQVLVLRDYHADNLMLLAKKEGLDTLGLLDFQDALIGSPAYDLVSLLEDARRDVSASVSHKLLAYYISHFPYIDASLFLENYAVLGAQRNLKIIGIFMRLARRDQKPHYLQHIPRVWRYLQNDLEHPTLKPLKDLLDSTFSQTVRIQVPAFQKAA